MTARLRVLFDVNVLIDVLLDRAPWAAPAARLLALCERRVLQGYWCAASVGTVHFLIRRELGATKARQLVGDLLRILEVAPVDGSVIGDALRENWPDVEDAIVHAAARQAGITHLVTRNPKDFRKASLTVCSPDGLLAALAQRGGVES